MASLPLKMGQAGGLVLPAAFAKHSATVILLHGLGDSAEGLEDLAQAWRQQLPHIKFILPTAPTRAITRFMGQSTTAWFNINSNSDRYQDPCEGLEESGDFVQSLVRAERALGLPRQRIVLAGFSQGGALSLFSGLQKPRESTGEAEGPLGGLLILSAYLPKVHSFTLHSDYRSVPVLHCHGEADQMVSTSLPPSLSICFSGDLLWLLRFVWNGRKRQKPSSTRR